MTLPTAVLGVAPDRTPAISNSAVITVVIINVEVYMSFDKFVAMVESKEVNFYRYLDTYACALLERLKGYTNTTKGLANAVNVIYGNVYCTMHTNSEIRLKHNMFEVGDFLHPKNRSVGMGPDIYTLQVEDFLHISSNTLTGLFYENGDYPTLEVHQIRAIMAKILEVARKLEQTREETK